jgi:hypothetical protein
MKETPRAKSSNLEKDYENNGNMLEEAIPDDELPCNCGSRRI